MDAQRPSAAALARLETRDRFPKTPLGYFQRRPDSLPPRHRLAGASDSTRFVVRVMARSLSLRRTHLFHHDRRAALHAPVLTRVDRLSQPAREPRRSHRLLRKLRRRHARASRLLCEPRARFSRLWTKRLGHHGVRQRQRLSRVGWPTTRSGHRRYGRSFRGGWFADVHTRARYTCVADDERALARDLRQVWLCGRLQSQDWLDRHRRHRHQRRHHSSQRRKYAHWRRLALVHAEPRDSARARPSRAAISRSATSCGTASSNGKR